MTARSRVPILLSEVCVAYAPSIMGRRALFDMLGGKQVSPFVALNRVSLAIEAGSSIAVIGQNGAGKSTLLKVAAGILPPSRGDVTIHGSVGTLLDLGAGLEGALDGWKNIELAAALQRFCTKRTLKFRDYVADFSGLGPALSRPVRTYSAGMTLRLLFSLRTFVEPDILVIDEVFGAGDHAFTKKANARMRELLNCASTVIFASHDHHLLQELCTQAVWLDHGTIVAQGAVADVIGRYLDAQSAPAGNG